MIDLTGGKEVFLPLGGERGLKGDTGPQGLKGETGPAGAGGVTSFKTRTGAVVPQSHDYTATQVDFVPGDTSMSATNVQEAIKELHEKAEESSGGGITEISIASSKTLGGIKVGSGLSVTATGVLSCITQAKVQTLINNAIAETQIGTYKAKISATYSADLIILILLI